jgi:hypothetical protein
MTSIDIGGNMNIFDVICGKINMDVTPYLLIYYMSNIVYMACKVPQLWNCFISFTVAIFKDVRLGCAL